jgi:hypothetical protein
MAYGYSNRQLLDVASRRNRKLKEKGISTSSNVRNPHEIAGQELALAEAQEESEEDSGKAARKRMLDAAKKSRDSKLIQAGMSTFESSVGLALEGMAGEREKKYLMGTDKKPKTGTPGPKPTTKLRRHGKGPYPKGKSQKYSG